MLTVGSVINVMMNFGSDWNATREEIDGAVVGDDVCSDARTIATRCITINASPDEVFPWIRQLGFGRAGWYSYDWIDNLGRKSATTINPDWQDVHTGSRVPGGPIDFEAALVDAPHSFVLRIGSQGKFAGRFCFTLAYELRPDPLGTRLVTRMRAHIDLPGGRIAEYLLSLGDGIMVRKQLLTLAQRVNTD